VQINYVNKIGQNPLGPVLAWHKSPPLVFIINIIIIIIVNIFIFNFFKQVIYQAMIKLQTITLSVVAKKRTKYL
jgi:hypothetical protein